MQKLAEISIRRPVFATMLILALVVVGAAAFLRLGVDRFPAVDLPSVSVRTTLPGASPETMESEVSDRIEEAVNTVEGIEELRSVSAQGTSFVIATFSLDRDIDLAAQDVRDRVAGAVRDLPDDAEPPVVSKQNADSSPVVTVSLSGQRSMRELTEIADKLVKEQIERSAGVGDVEVVGGLGRSINVWVDAEKLAAHNLPVTAVRDALIAQNTEVPGGNVTGRRREQVLRTMGRITDPRAFNDIVIARVNGVPIRVRDVGVAEDGTKEQRSVSRLNGTPSVQINVRRQSGANSVAVIEGVKAKLEQIRPRLPAGVTMEVIRDQSRYIYAALHEIDTHLIVGSILACLVVLAFVGSWRSTFIAAVAIPTSVISTFGVMWMLGFTLNSVTMLALVLMVGIVIDDAIVVLENIFRFVEEKRMTPMEAARAGTAEIGLAVLATTLSLVVIFIPVSFMSSISGRFLYQFGITAAVAVLVSLLVSFTLTPMMSARLLKSSPSPLKGEGRGEGRRRGAPENDDSPKALELDPHPNPLPSREREPIKSRGGFYSHIDRCYSWMLRRVMHHRVSVAAVAAFIIVSAMPMYRLVRQEFVPTDVDEAEFEVRVSAPEGTSFTAMNQIMLSLEDDLKSIPAVRVVQAQVGGGFIGGSNSGEAYVRIAPHDQRYFSLRRLWRETLNGTPLNAFRENYSQAEVMNRIRAVAREKYLSRDIRVSVRNYPSINLGGGNFEIDFVVKGPDLQTLAAATEALRERALADSRGGGLLAGVQDADTTLKLNKPELRVNIDRERAADLSVSPRDLGTALRLLVGGDEEVTRFHDPQTNEDYDVQLRLTEPHRADDVMIPRLLLPRNRDAASGSSLVELRNLATLEESTTPSRIDRLDRSRAAALRGSVGQGYALQDRIDSLRQAFAELNLPPAYSATVGGRGRELERTFWQFAGAFALSIVFMYMILAAQYESLSDPLIILLSLPLSVPFALLSIWAMGGTLNLYSALGILVLFGVVKKNAILQIDHTNQLRARGMRREDAIIRGSRDRLRPILMTTLALVAGMTPLALGSGPGAEERRAVALVVIGGQSLALLLTLLVTPVVYSLFDDARRTIRRRAQHEAIPATGGAEIRGDGIPAPAVK
jgi:HAE1 family hydrophobic/amphiphilic exporter-1